MARLDQSAIDRAGGVALARRPTIAEIKRAVTDHYGLVPDALESRRRWRWVTHPRQLAMWLSQRLTQHSCVTIGTAFKRDPTTVLYAWKVLPVRLMLDPDVRQDCHAVIARIDLIRRSNVIPFPNPSRRLASPTVESAAAVLAAEMQRDLPGTLAKLLRRTIDGPEIETR